MAQILEANLAQLLENCRSLLPGGTSLEVLNAVMQGRRCRLTDFEPETVAPCTPFGDLLAEAFDKGMDPDDWRLVTHPITPQAAKRALRAVWETEVLAKFAAKYQLR